MGVIVKYLITVDVEYVGEVLLSENTSVSKQMKHKELLHHFIT